MATKNERNDVETIDPEKTTAPPQEKEPVTDQVALLDANDQPVRTVANPAEKGPNGKQLLHHRITVDDQAYERVGTNDEGQATYRPS